MSGKPPPTAASNESSTSAASLPGVKKKQHESHGSLLTSFLKSHGSPSTDTARRQQQQPDQPRAISQTALAAGDSPNELTVSSLAAQAPGSVGNFGADGSAVALGDATSSPMSLSTATGMAQSTSSTSITRDVVAPLNDPDMFTQPRQRTLTAGSTSSLPSTFRETSGGSKKPSRFMDFFHSGGKSGDTGDPAGGNHALSTASASHLSLSSLSSALSMSGGHSGGALTVQTIGTGGASSATSVTPQSAEPASADSFASRYGSLRRQKGGPSSSQHSSTSTLNRMSRRLRDTMGLYDGGQGPTSADSETSSMFSFSVETEPASAIDNEDVVDELTETSASPAYRTVQVYLRSGRVPSQVRVNSAGTVEDLLHCTLATFSAAIAPDIDCDPAMWKVAKVDRNQLITRVWLSHEMSLDSYKINDGDELRLKHVTETDVLEVHMPPSTTPKHVEFGFEDTVKSIIDKLTLETDPPTPGVSNGLYYRRMGIWLDEKRTMMSYELDPDHIVDLRVISQEFLLRIQLSEFDTRFTIKVLPSLTVGDVISLVHYNISARRIDLDALRHSGGNDPFSSPFSAEKSVVDLKATHYALFLQSRNLWLAEHKTMEEYELHRGGGVVEDVQFKVQFRPIILCMPQFMMNIFLDSRIRFSSTSGPQETAKPSRYVQIFAGAETRVRNLVEMLNLENQSFEDDVIAVNANSGDILSERADLYGIFTLGGERLSDQELVWTCLKDSSPLELFEYRMGSRKVPVTCTGDSDAKNIMVELDVSRNFQDSLPIILRRFGADSARSVATCSLVFTNNAGSSDFITLDPERSLVRQGFRQGSSLQLDVKVVTSEADITAHRTIWHEAASDSESNIKYSESGDGVVTAATLNKLIERLTSADSGGESTQYLDFMKTFLLTYQSFTTPSEFLAKLIERYHVPRQKETCPTFAEFEKLRFKIQLRTVNVLQQWTKKYTSDFVDLGALQILKSVSSHGPSSLPTDVEKRLRQAKEKHDLLMKVQEFAESIVTVDHALLGRQLRKNLLRLRDGTFVSVRQQQAAAQAAPPPATRFGKLPSSFLESNGGVKQSIFACDPEEIARQLTVLEFDLFSKIAPSEFLNQAWTRPDADVRTPNVLMVTRRFNNVALWVVKSILEVKTVRARAKRVTKLVDIAAFLYSMNNFATLMAFIAGFNKAPVTRLKHTMKELNGKTMKKLVDLERIMTAESSYKNYRTKIHNVNPPCIPYLGVYLLDLTYMEDGNPNKIGQLINFSKRRLIHTLIREVQQYQDQPFSFKPVDELVTLLNRALSLPILADGEISGRLGDDGSTLLTLKAFEDLMFENSLQREPRGAERSAVI